MPGKRVKGVEAVIEVALAKSDHINSMSRLMGTLMTYLKGNTCPKGHDGEAADTWIKHG